MKVRHQHTEGEKIELQMTPMIDIVFQLLVFFIMTFKIVSQEGDFNIKMPLGQSAGAQMDESLPPIRVILTANANGELSGIRLTEQPLDNFEELTTEIAGIVGSDESMKETTEVELVCDYDLHYEYVVNAITAVSGYVDDAGNIIKLVEKIKFAPPKSPSPG